MAGNGKVPAALTLSITLNPGSGQVELKGPLRNPELCIQMLNAATATLFRHAVREARGEQPERKVQTLDELGVRRIGRVQ